MIELKNLTKRFGNQSVFENINLKINPGEVVGIIGPSGAGKSTLMRCLNLLETPDSGSVVIDNASYAAPKVSSKEKIAIRQKSSMVFQQFNLFKQKTVLDNVAEGLVTVKGIPVNKAQDIARNQIERVHLSEHTNKYPGQLSGGQKQRVGIARALAMSTELLLLDEPTSALDDELVGDVLETLKDVIHRNTEQTTIIISHELSFIKEVSTRVLFFDQGTIIEDGSAKEVFENPKHQRTIEFLERYRNRAI